MRYIPVLLVLFSFSARAGDDCARRGELAGQMVATKYATIATLKEKPETGSMGDVWRYLAFIYMPTMRKLGDSDARIIDTAKLIDNYSFTDDWRYELLIFNEYFKSSCEVGNDPLMLKSDDIPALWKCAYKTPDGDGKLNACVKDFVKKMK